MEKDAYFAGLIDGEGFIGEYLRKDRKNSTVRMVYVKMSCHKTIQALRDEFGGSIAFRPAQKAHWKDQWQWQARYKTALQVLERISPYMITKRDLADHFLHKWKTERATPKPLA